MKHTPGPWSHSEQKGKPGHCNVAQIWDSKGEYMAHVVPTENEDEATATAALIAAAPDLLEAAKCLIDPKRTGREAWEKLKAAIKKAEEKK